ncbi:MAG: MBL fold metallo-hydrolase [Phycisphaerae bacterium]|nr:MBL fold metallo-hydrolase [Phycisphaerae bacterium]
MRVSFFGASGEVTGSSYLVEVAGASVLVDCGLFQGGAKAELKCRRPFCFDPTRLSAVILTHAHLDHSGRLPQLVKRGYRGRITTTIPSLPLADILLRDAAYLQKADIERLCRKRRQRAGDRPCPDAQPLFTDEDVTAALRLFTLAPYGKAVPVAPGFEVTFFDAGHILGSSSLLLRLRDGGKERTIVFSGDVGERHMPLLHDPVTPGGVGPAPDLVIHESTYGDRDHKPLDATFSELDAVVEAARADGGRVLIPSFAIGRTQTLLYYFLQRSRARKLGMPVVLDSPMGIAATRLYLDHKDLLDDAARALIDGGAIQFPELRLSRTGEESRGLNDLKGPAVIIAGAGMCNGGRIVHHLRQHLHKPNTHVAIVGYQAEGTLGRRLVNRDPVVRIHQQEIEVRAQIHTLGGLSAHAGRSTLLHWLAPLLSGGSRPTVALTHGEDKQRQALAAGIVERYGVPAMLPRFGEHIDL